MLASDVLRLVSGALQDLEPGTEKRWGWTGGDCEGVGLLDFLNAAIRAVALQRPDATARTEAIPLEPGVRQKLPKNALTLIEVLRNLGNDGETPGAAIAIMHVDVLLAMSAYTPTASVVQQYAYERMTNSNVFWVYPPVTDAREVFVEATYSVKPKEVVSPDDTLPVADMYMQALVHHILAAILSGDNEASNANKAQLHIGLWNNIMGIKQGVDSQWPKTRSVA